MCEALRIRQLAGHPWEIENTFSKSGPFHGPQTYSFRPLLARGLHIPSVRFDLRESVDKCF